MRLILNWMLLCLLALALPLQGLAAVGARACQPVGAAGAAAAPVAVQQRAAAPMHTEPTMHGTPHAEHAAHGGEADHGAPEAASAAHGHGHGHGHDHDHHGHGDPLDAPQDAHAHSVSHPDAPTPASDDHSCSSCASCCVGAALPVTVAVFATRAGPSALVPTQPATAPGWLPPHPQRPPRPVAR